MAAHYKSFRELDVEVLGISTDSVCSHKIFAETSPSAQKVQYPLLSDPTREISACYGALNPETGFATRTTFIVSPAGDVEYFCKYPEPVGRNVEELIRMIQAIRFTDDTGLGAPAGWRPGELGEPGLSTDWDMVGKI